MGPMWLLISTNKGCLNIHGTHGTANNSTTNNIEFFFVSDLKIVYYNKLSILDHNALDKKSKNILCHQLFGDKIIQKSLKINATH